MGCCEACNSAIAEKCLLGLTQAICEVGVGGIGLVQKEGHDEC